jgi:hypothetical protein
MPDAADARADSAAAEDRDPVAGKPALTTAASAAIDSAIAALAMRRASAAATSAASASCRACDASARTAPHTVTSAELRPAAIAPS